MQQATFLWTHWQALLLSFTNAFTVPGHRRFAEWITGLVLTIEEHFLTRSIIAVDRTAHWKAIESFVEYGAWDTYSVCAALTKLVDAEPGRTWHGYRIVAVDDTKVHRDSPNVWLDFRTSTHS